MAKVLTDQEVAAERKKGNHGYSEQWVVEYLAVNEAGLWELRTINYNTYSKSRGKDVEKRWRKDFQGKQVHLKNVLYQ